MAFHKKKIKNRIVQLETWVTVDTCRVQTDSFNPPHCLENRRWKRTSLFPMQHSLLSHLADITGGFQGSSSKTQGLTCSTWLCLLLSLHMSTFCITSIQSASQELNKLSNNETTWCFILGVFFWGSDKALLLKPDEEFLPLKSRLAATSVKQWDSRRHGEVTKAACHFNSRIYKAVKVFTHCHIAGRQVTL